MLKEFIEFLWMYAQIALVVVGGALLIPVGIAGLFIIVAVLTVGSIVMLLLYILICLGVLSASWLTGSKS